MSAWMKPLGWHWFSCCEARKARALWWAATPVFLDVILDQSDFLLQFKRREQQGRLRTLITTVKSRQMQHAPEEFELEVDPEGVEVRPAPLVRQSGSGDLKPVPISLFLHAETKNHQEHNQRMVEGVRAIISPKAEILTQSRRFDPNLLAMSEFSAVDELQIFQIDEFQLPTARSCSESPSILYSFDAAANSSLLEGRLPKLCAMVSLPGSQRLIAIPFYANLSFFALRKPLVEAALRELGLDAWPGSWIELAALCKKWEALNPDPQKIFFSSPIYEHSVETLNCLFFEILYTYRPPTGADHDDLSLWLDRPEALDAAVCFRTLCRRSYLRSKNKQPQLPALITRHWYNTLNEELWETAGEEVEIEVKPLFDDVSTAGEWYLAIPAHSAAPDIGLRLIDFLTQSDRETTRAELGVGLPTHTKYYESEQASISRYFRFSRANVRRLLEKAFRRSDFYRYQRASGTVSSHLEWLLEIGADPGAGKEIGRAMDSLVESVRFIVRSERAG